MLVSEVITSDPIFGVAMASIVLYGTAVSTEKLLTAGVLKFEFELEPVLVPEPVVPDPLPPELLWASTPGSTQSSELSMYARTRIERRPRTSVLATLGVLIVR